MALHRISSSCDFLTALSRVSHTASTSIGEMQCTRYAAVHQNRMKSLHVTSVRRYPDPPAISLPTNLSEIFANETGRFTPERYRDIAAPMLLYSKNDCRSSFSEQFAKPVERTGSISECDDTHVDSYDCFGAVSLNGTMQSNVPKPFCSNGKSMHLNMPGGQWARDGKYIAEDMQKSHYRSTLLPQVNTEKSGLASYVATNSIFQMMYKPRCIYAMEYSTKVSQPSDSLTNSDDKKPEVVEPAQLSKREKFNRIVKDYGITVVVFHVAISLVSLGVCYMGIVSGIDFKPIIQSMFVIKNEQIEDMISSSSTFLIAYSVHKLMAPVRISITLGVTPFLVKRLRKYGILKPPKKT